MNSTLLEHLSMITPEENRLLAGEKLDKALYTQKKQFVVESEKMLAGGSIISVLMSTRKSPTYNK